MVNMTLNLPPNILNHIEEILRWIFHHQHYISLYYCHQFQGYLYYISLVIPGARGIFRHTNYYLVVHSALEEFQWIEKDFRSSPMRIQELTPLITNITCNKNELITICRRGGVCIPRSHTIPFALQVLPFLYHNQKHPPPMSNDTPYNKISQKEYCQNLKLRII